MPYLRPGDGISCRTFAQVFGNAQGEAEKMKPMTIPQAYRFPSHGVFSFKNKTVRGMQSLTITKQTKTVVSINSWKPECAAKRKTETEAV